MHCNFLALYCHSVALFCIERYVPYCYFLALSIELFHSLHWGSLTLRIPPPSLCIATTSFSVLHFTLSFLLFLCISLSYSYSLYCHSLALCIIPLSLYVLPFFCCMYWTHTHIHTHTHTHTHIYIYIYELMFSDYVFGIIHILDIKSF